MCSFVEIHTQNRTQIMKSVSFYIQKDKENSKGLCPIIAQVTIKSKNYRASIGKVKARYWNKSKQKVNKNREIEPYNQHIELNQFIEDISSNLNRFNRFDSYNEPPKIDEVKKVILTIDTGTKSFNKAYDEFIESNKNLVAPNTTRNRITAKNFISDYQEYHNLTLQFEDITEELFEQLYIYAFEVRGIIDTDKEEMENNTFASYIAKFKSFLEWSTKKGYYKGKEHHKYSFAEKDKNVICLTPTEFKSLYNFNFENNTYDKTRDLYCFGCLTGLRFSDIQSLRNEHIQGDSIIKKINKTKQESCIPILPQAQQILDKYKGDSFYPLPRLSNQKLNEYIKECCKLAGIKTPTIKQTYKGNQITETSHPKYELITAHTARKTFITIGFMNGLNVKIIKSITGHKKEATFDKYLKISDQMKKDELKKAWDF